MEVDFKDYNDGGKFFGSEFAEQWNSMSHVLSSLVPHFKFSDQKGKENSIIFDPVGMNAAIKEGLEAAGWNSNVRIPKAFTSFGAAYDFTKGPVLGEAQFSNYPFLSNNMIRSELLLLARESLARYKVGALIMITKSRVFPASNSTLYYEQARGQLELIEKAKLFSIPTRLVGLICKEGEMRAFFTDRVRTSRDMASKGNAVVSVSKKPVDRGSYVMELISPTIDELRPSKPA